MRRFKYIVGLFLLSSMIILGGCRKGPSSSYSKKKQIKRGKPIPCPIKDC